MTGAPVRVLSIRVVTAAALIAGATLAACVEDPLALDSANAPGETAQTRDFTLKVSDVPTWRDTTYTGFALPNEARFDIVSNGSKLGARVLGRLNVPDTINTFADTLPVDVFDSLDVRFQIDTVRSEFSAFPVTLKMIELTSPFDADSVTWLETGLGPAWMTPGGDLGVVIGSVEITGMSDSLIMTPDLPADSLLKAWQDTDGENGYALVLEGPEARINVQQVQFRYDALLQGRTRPVSREQVSIPRTFITDPVQPPSGMALRIGGLPASRFYVDFDLPAQIGGIPLVGSTINHAELDFEPLPPPAEPFALERPLASRIMTLLADPFVFGAKTPIGSSPLRFTPLDPDSLSGGRMIRLDITLLVVSAVRNGDLNIRIGLRGVPDAQALGFWEFGSEESPPELRPRLRIVLTPPPVFPVP